MLPRRAGVLIPIIVAVACSEAPATDDTPVTHHSGLGGAAGSGGVAGVPTGGTGAGAKGGTGTGGTSANAGSSAKGGAGATGGTGGATSTGGSGTAGTAGSGTAGTGGSGGTSAAPTCSTTFTYKGAGAQVVVAGEWNNFDPKGTPLTKDASGAFVGQVPLPPGLWGYKVIVDGTWQLDPGQGRRKWVGGVENSGMKVGDCRLPTLAVSSSQPARPAPGAGTYAAKLVFQDGIEGSGPDAAGYAAEVVSAGQTKPLDAAAVMVDAAKGDVTVSLGALADGKYTVVLTPKTKNGRVGLPLRLPFWIEAEAFSWKDALIYMVMTDRFQNGDKANDVGATANVDPRADFHNGDLVGLKQAIDAGTLDALGVRAIWISPWQTNPKTAWPAADGIHQVTGYHGYWPVKAREVDPRLGGEAALRAVVTSAHAHGIRVLQDYVVNHVHKDHEYFAQHKEWFRTGCVCGTTNCDWTTHALDCLFADYMPDVNHTVPEATAQWAADGVFWLDAFDLDGLRIDAVKHVEEAATRNLAAEVRETFEKGGTKYFLMGETAMGWSDCPDPCNDENYGTIAKYIGPLGLDGQFDFVLYHGVSYNTFAWGTKGMLHADYWFQHGMQHWPADAIMTAYIGSHDTSRFATMADYRFDSGPKSKDTAGAQWDGVAVAPTDGEPYARTRLAFSWLLGLPGAPLLYYGDEYGQWGSADPNNRQDFRSGAALSSDESTTLAFVQKLGKARQGVPALRRGAYVPFPATTDDTLVFGRKTATGEAAVVALTRLDAGASASIEVQKSLGFAAGTILHDRLGGPDVTVAGDGTIALSVSGKSAVVLAPLAKPSATMQALYDSPLHNPALFWLVGTIVLALAARKMSFVLGWVVLAAFEIMADATITGGLSPVPAGSAWGQPLGILFVLLGDFRYFVLVERFARGSVSRALGTAAAFTAIVPLISQVLMRIAPSLFASSRWVFLIYEALFLVLAIVLRTFVVPRRLATATPAIRTWLLRITTFEIVQYALWALADVIILAGVEPGFLLRIVPNVLYYAAFVPFVWATAPAEQTS